MGPISQMQFFSEKRLKPKASRFLCRRRLSKSAKVQKDDVFLFRTRDSLVQVSSLRPTSSNLVVGQVYVLNVAPEKKVGRSIFGLSDTVFDLWSVKKQICSPIREYDDDDDDDDDLISSPSGDGSLLSGRLVLPL